MATEASMTSWIGSANLLVRIVAALANQVSRVEAKRLQALPKLP